MLTEEKIINRICRYEEVKAEIEELLNETIEELFENGTSNQGKALYLKKEADTLSLIRSLLKMQIPS